jgi:glycosyltransferase involved in cell wall biosynthesis
MKILWVKSDFLHPTTKGGHIRTLETLKRLHQRHQIHYVAFDLAEQPGGVERSAEYSTRSYPIPHSAPPRGTLLFWLQLLNRRFSPLPLAIRRYQSDAMRRQVETLIRSQKFDSIVCDFLTPAPNIPDLGAAVLFQHNVEAMIWKRQFEHASRPLERRYLRGQYERMRNYEGEVSRAVKRIIAVSDTDAETLRSWYGVSRVASVPTGVDIQYFTPSQEPERSTDLVFLGSMDWMANIDAMQWFVAEILPLIRKKRPDCSLTIVGRRPSAEILQLAQKDTCIQVTGTVEDVRPYLWPAGVSIVPLRIGGGTRLKIYESMAAKVPVVSTAVGAEGLEVHDNEDISIACSPAEFAERCLALLEDRDASRRMAAAAWEMVSACYSWDVVARKFEQLLF